MKSKRIILGVLAAALILPTLQSCKKGSEDPGLSLKSRDSRITGTWTMKSMEYSWEQTTDITTNNSVNTDVYTKNSTMSSSRVFDGTNYTNTDVDNWDEVDTYKEWNGTAYATVTKTTNHTESTTEEGTMSLMLSLYKDNTATLTTNTTESTKVTEGEEKYSISSSTSGTTTDLDSTYTVGDVLDNVLQGTWYWTEGTVKNKIHITTSFFDGYVVRLTNKELIIEGKYHDNDITSSNNDDVKVDFAGWINNYSTTAPTQTWGTETTNTVTNIVENTVRMVFEKTDKASKRE